MKIFRKYEFQNEQILFLIYGALNFLVTNVFLHIFLLLVPIIIATILSQTVNIIIGFYLYGKSVFKVNNLNNLVFKRYLLLAIILWMLNFSFIQSFFYVGVHKNLTAVIIVPFLVIISYISQKYYVFK